VNYLGQVWGGRVFDNSYDRGAPVRFPIGVGAVIQGWDEARDERSSPCCPPPPGPSATSRS